MYTPSKSQLCEIAARIESQAFGESDQINK